MATLMVVAAVIPAFNEKKYIGDVVRKTSQFVDYVIVVDDGSSDETYSIVRSMNNKVIALRHDINLGKGAALKTGCEAACRLKVDVIVCIDADNQHNPSTIPQFLNTLIQEKTDIVFGMRQFNRHMPFMMLFGNYLLSNMINWFFHMVLHDTQSGFRVFTTEAYRKIVWESSGYEAETEMIVRAGEQSLRYKEINIDTIYHDSYKGTTVLDGIRIFFYILRWKFI